MWLFCLLDPGQIYCQIKSTKSTKLLLPVCLFVWYGLKHGTGHNAGWDAHCSDKCATFLGSPLLWQTQARLVKNSFLDLRQFLVCETEDVFLWDEPVLQTSYCVVPAQHQTPGSIMTSVWNFRKRAVDATSCTEWMHLPSPAAGDAQISVGSNSMQRRRATAWCSAAIGWKWVSGRGQVPEVATAKLWCIGYCCMAGMRI